MQLDDYSLLITPIFRVNLEGHSVSLSLPQVFAALSQKKSVVFIGLQRHHQDPWHMFLCQTAAMAVLDFGNATLPTDAETWATLLTRLANDKPDAWILVNPQREKPAFMQPPTPAPGVRWKDIPEETPESFDIACIEKSVDVKIHRICEANLDIWVYYLVTYQTMSGYGGAKNYGVVRMNGGSSSRACFGYMVPGATTGQRFFRDVHILVRCHERLLDGPWGFKRSGGKRLLWLEPWLGDTSLTISDCSPYFVEICRLVRLDVRNGQLIAWTAPTEKARIDGKTLAGDTGDPWGVVENRNKKIHSLSVQARGFHYSLMADILFDDSTFRLGDVARLQDDDPQELVFRSAVLARGNCKSFGFQERIIPISAKARSRLSKSQGFSLLSRLSKEQVGIASRMRQVLAGSVKQLSDEKGFAFAWLDRFDTEVDDIFFLELWSNSDDGLDGGKFKWFLCVRKIAYELLDEAIEMTNPGNVQWYKRVSFAKQKFFDEIHKQKLSEYERKRFDDFLKNGGNNGRAEEQKAHHD